MNKSLQINQTIGQTKPGCTSTTKYLSVRAGILLLLLGLSALLWQEAVWPIWGTGLAYGYALSVIVTKRIKLPQTAHLLVLIALSLIRILFFGYCMIWSAQGSRSQLLLVLAGFLGYSSVLFIELLFKELLKSRQNKAETLIV